MTMGWPLPILRQVKYGRSGFLWEGKKIIYFSGSTAAYYLKVGRCIELDD